jgi:[acyl-carrier-protein] S-malonyltransferase
MSKIAFVFPGQGSQYIGMGKDFYENFEESKKVYERANEVLEKDLSNLCFDGKEEDLTKTENTQPAILATSIAMLKALESKGIKADYTAGLSLGEYTSLVYAGSLIFEDALKVVVKRGKFMQEAVPIGIGGMAAILALDEEKVSKAVEVGKTFGEVEIANYNSPGQIVISGELEAVKKACEEALKLGAKKAVALDVSAPFHSNLLAPAGERLKEELEKLEFHDLNKNLVSNVDAKITIDKEELKEKLVRQVSSSVLWQQSVENMINDGVEIFIEIGPGKTLTGFIKRIAKKIGRKDIKALNIKDIDSFNKTMDILTGGL